MLKKWQISALEDIAGWDEFLNAESSADKNKKLLLEMARRGEPRPRTRNHSLGYCLCHYTNPQDDSYDEAFDKEIRNVGKSWFVDTAAENKKKLIEMAKLGEKRPNQRNHPLGIFLTSYTVKTRSKRPAYDVEFDKEIRALRPDWFVDATTENKNKLLDMARNGHPKPLFTKQNTLAQFLKKHVDQNDVLYDLEFDTEIRKLRPDWFVDIVAENKKELLRMATSGEPKPFQKKHPLGKCLAHYTSSKSRSYDKVFDEEIRNVGKSWFVDTAAENKRELIEMARRGEGRPARNYILQNYIAIGGSSYDPEFDAQIRKLAPHWFKKDKK